MAAPFPPVLIALGRRNFLLAVVFDKSLRVVTSYPEPRPGEDECVVRVRLAGIGAIELDIVRERTGFRGVPGSEFVGVVETGPAEWKGKRVVADVHCVCRRCDMCQSGLSNHCRKRTMIGVSGRDGAFATRLTVPTRNLHAVPDAVSDEEAVFAVPLAAAMQVLAQCKVEPRSRVCVVGSGRLGLLVAQVLSTTGCRLTVVGRNPRTLELAEKRGIQTTHTRDLVPRNDQDVVVECTGAAEGLSLALRLARPRGAIVLKSRLGKVENVDLTPIVTNEITLAGSHFGPVGEAVATLARQAIDVRPMITRVYPLDRALEAFEAAASPEHVKILLKS